MNYETVKHFGAEKLEKSRFDKIIDKLKMTMLEVQYSLTRLNIV